MFVAERHVGFSEILVVVRPTKGGRSGILHSLMASTIFEYSMVPIPALSRKIRPNLSHLCLVAGKVAAGVMPAALAAPAFAIDSIVEAMPTQSVALEVQFGAYLAVALGTLLPCLFLINLFIQTESRKAGREGGIDAE